MSPAPWWNAQLLLPHIGVSSTGCISGQCGLAPPFLQHGKAFVPILHAFIGAEGARAKNPVSSKSIIRSATVRRKTCCCLLRAMPVLRLAQGYICLIIVMSVGDTVVFWLVGPRPSANSLPSKA